MTIIEKLSLVLLVIFSMGNLAAKSVGYEGVMGDKKVAFAMERVAEAVENKISTGGDSVDDAQLKEIVFKVLEDMQQGEQLEAPTSESSGEISTDEEPAPIVAETESVVVLEPQEDVVEAIEEEVYLEDEGVAEAEIDDESKVTIAKEDDWKRLLIEKADTLAKAALILYPSWIMAKKHDGSIPKAVVYMIFAGVVLNLMGSDF